MKTNWPTKNLEDIVEFQNGLWTGKKAPFVAAPILRNTNFKNGDGLLNYDDVAEIEVEKKQLEKRTLSKGDILLERSGGGPTQPVGRVVYFEGENNRFGFSNFTTRIRVKGSDVDSKYLWFFLHSFYKSGKTELMQKKTTGIRNLTFSEYKQIEIPLPPLEVQKKIVTKLESLLAKISEAKKLRAEAQENADNLLSAELHKIFEEGKSKDWRETTLGAVLDLCDSGTWGEESSDGLPLLRSTNMQNGNLILDDLKTIAVPKDKINRYLLREGDILITKSSGSVNHIGKSLYITKEMHEKYGFSNFTQRLRINKEQALPKWIYIKISDQGTRDFLLNASQTTTGLRNLKILALKELKILLPPLTEQKKIVAHLDSISQKVQEVKELQNTTQKELDVLERSILSKAFSGELI